jgi:hypothetical protein
LGRGLVRGFDLNLNGLANSQACHPCDSQTPGGRSGGLPSRIENRGSERHLNASTESRHRESRRFVKY